MEIVQTSWIPQKVYTLHLRAEVALTADSLNLAPGDLLGLRHVPPVEGILCLISALFQLCSHPSASFILFLPFPFSFNYSVLFTHLIAFLRSKAILILKLYIGNQSLENIFICAFGSSIYLFFWTLIPFKLFSVCLFGILSTFSYSELKFDLQLKLHVLQVEKVSFEHMLKIPVFNFWDIY